MELSAEQKAQLEEQKQHCPFCKIIRGEIPSQQVYEDDKVVAILDINPAEEGHTLLVPKEHYPVMALLPEDLFAHVFEVLPQMTKRLREAVLANHCSVFIANGAAAGQQSGHFMIHLIPSDKPLPYFQPPREKQDAQAVEELEGVLSHNLPLMMRERSGLFPLEQEADAGAPADEGGSQRLAQLLEENPQFKQMLIDKPEAVLAGLQDNPSLAPLFEGVDVHALSERLAQQAADEQPAPADPEPAESPGQSAADDPEEVPRAVDLSDEQLRTYLQSKQRLKHYLLTDLETLQDAIDAQPRLQQFFDGTSPQEVRARISSSQSRSLDDLAEER